MKSFVAKGYLVVFILAFLVSCSKNGDVTTTGSSDKLIVSIALNAFSPAITGAINQTTKTVSFTVPPLTDVTNLVPTITVSAGASVSPASGVGQNFTNPVSYKVTAQDGSQQVYTVTAQITKSSSKAITAFSFQGLSPAVSCVVNDTTYLITATLPSATSLSALVPTISISAGATINPASGVAQDFTKEVAYTVTAQDGSTQIYKVNISQQTSSSSQAMVVQLIENATYPSTYGVIAQINSAYATFQHAIIYPKDTTVKAASATGAIPSFSYTSTWLDTEKVISQGTPPTAVGLRNTFNFNGTGNYNDGSLFSSNYTDAGNFVITYLYSNVPFSTNYSRSETLVALTGSKNTFTDKFTWTSTNILVSRTTGLIMSGTATVALVVTSSGQTNSYQGTITFSGNNQGSLSLNGVVVAVLQWQ